LKKEKLATTSIGDTGIGWFVYMIQTSDDTLYTGITLDIKRRWGEHMATSDNNLTKGTGAKFFRGRSPEMLVFLVQSLNRSTATKEEITIKSLSRKDKLLLIASSTNKLDLFPELSNSCSSSR